MNHMGVDIKLLLIALSGLQVASHFPSGIVERVKREHV